MLSKLYACRQCLTKHGRQYDEDEHKNGHDNGD